MASQLYILMGSIGFALLLVISLVQPQRCEEKQDLWVGFCTIQLVALILGLLYGFIDAPYRGLPRFMITLVVLLASVVLIIFAMLSVAVLVSSLYKRSPKDHFVQERKNRLALAISSLSLSLPPCWYSLLHFSVFYLTKGTTLDDEARAEWILRIVQFATGLAVIPSLFVLRPYHLGAAAALGFGRKGHRTGALPLITPLQPQHPPAVPVSYPRHQNPPQLIYPPAAPVQKTFHPQFNSPSPAATDGRT
ncbi:hypothetical protein Aduo_016254 [Ancylostoma duodenale]